jgi:hypothetical protein
MTAGPTDDSNNKIEDVFRFLGRIDVGSHVQVKVPPTSIGEIPPPTSINQSGGEEDVVRGKGGRRKGCVFLLLQDATSGW